MRPRLIRRFLAVSALGGWGVFVAVSAATLLRGGAAGTGDVFQVDWHVYWAAARDLVEGDLYRVPLDAVGRTLSADEFNLPPLSAAWAVPLLALPVLVGGYVWQAVAVAAIASSAIAAASTLRIPRPWLIAGLALGPLALTLPYLEGLHLGTNNFLVLALVAGASWAYLARRDTAAGLLLGLAVATKLWPATLLVVALRERRPRVAGLAAAVVGIQSLVLFGWLGFDALGYAVDNFRDPIPATGFLIGPTAVPGLRDAWHSGLGLVVAFALLALPLRGRAAIGAATLAGLAVIPNLWVHYAPTVLFGVALIAADIWRTIDVSRWANQSEDDHRPSGDQEPITHQDQEHREGVQRQQRGVQPRKDHDGEEDGGYQDRHQPPRRERDEGQDPDDVLRG